MYEEEIRAAVLATLKTIAPELQASEIQTDRPLRNQIDLDSISAHAYRTHHIQRDQRQPEGRMCHLIECSANLNLGDGQPFFLQNAEHIHTGAAGQPQQNQL